MTTVEVSAHEALLNYGISYQNAPPTGAVYNQPTLHNLHYL